MITLWFLILLAIESVVRASPKFYVGKLNINHRHGAQDPSPTNQDIKIKSTICELIDTMKHSERIEDDEARLWKRLGKLLLDSEEYAEAPLVFRRGAERCPNDEGLNHHLKVYNAYHSKVNGTVGDVDVDVDGVPPPLDLDGKEKDTFLTLDVPPTAIPDTIIRLAKKHSGSEPPHSLANLLHASKEPLLSKYACQYIINCAKKTAEYKGWTKDRHIQAPTCDIPTFELDPAAVNWLRNAIVVEIFPILSKVFPSDIGIDPKFLRIQDMFVVRYDGDNNDGSESPGFKSLNPHEDESIISLTIALNDMKEYDGGGLFITSTGDLLNGDAGTVLGFAGQIVHGGYPVSKGTRWILTVFLYLDKNTSGKKNGYILENIEGRLQS